MFYDSVQHIQIGLGLWPKTISLSKSIKPRGPMAYLCDSQQPEKKPKGQLCLSHHLDAIFFFFSFTSKLLLFSH